MNYTLVRAEEKLREFIEFLPDLKENESYFIILIARKKWNKDAAIPSALKLRRETVANKNKIIHTIKNWEVAKGNYQYDGVTIEEENLGVYIAYNPKNQLKACYTLIEKCLDKIKTNYQGINVKSIANDAIQISKGTKNFMDIDVDIKENENYEDIMAFIKETLGNSIKLTFIKTSGGFHCLIPTENLGGTWYKKIKEHPFQSELNIMSDDLMPLVGCRQGSFIPYVLEK
jgi:hypothetical protein